MGTTRQRKLLVKKCEEYGLHLDYFPSIDYYVLSRKTQSFVMGWGGAGFNGDSIDSFSEQEIEELVLKTSLEFIF